MRKARSISFLVIGIATAQFSFSAKPETAQPLVVKGVVEEQA